MAAARSILLHLGALVAATTALAVGEVAVRRGFSHSGGQASDSEASASATSPERVVGEEHEHHAEDGRPERSRTSPLRHASLGILREGRPNLARVGIIAFVGLGCVFAVDVAGHYLQHFIDDRPEEQGHLDSIIDGTAAYLALLMCFLWHGVLQEFIITERYPTGRFPSVPFLVFVGRGMGIVLSGTVVLIRGESLDFATCKWTSIPAVLQCFATMAEETSLLYITFPVVSVLKSMKVVPTMCINTALNGVQYAWKDYMLAIAITLSVAGFSCTARFNNDSPHPDSTSGVALMISAVISCALVCTTQKAIFVTFPTFSSMQMMLVMGVMEALLSGFVMIAQTDFWPVIVFIQSNPQCVEHLLALGLSSALGTYFVMLIIKRDGPVVLAVMMVVRQVLSVMLSSSLFDHRLSTVTRLFGIVTFLLAAYRPAMMLVCPDPTLTKVHDVPDSTLDCAHWSARLLTMTSARLRYLHGQSGRWRRVPEASPLGTEGENTLKQLSSPALEYGAAKSARL